MVNTAKTSRYYKENIMKTREVEFNLRVQVIDTEFGTIYTAYKGSEYLFTCKSEDDLISRLEIILRGLV